MARRHEDRYRRKKAAIEEELERIRSVTIYPQEGINDKLKAIGTAPLKTPATLADLLKRPEVTYEDIERFFPPPQELPWQVKEQVEIQIKYEGYIKRQEQQIKQFKKILARIATFRTAQAKKQPKEEKQQDA